MRYHTTVSQFRQCPYLDRKKRAFLNNACIFFACIYPCIHSCFTSTVAGTEKTLDSRNDAAFNTCNHFVCLQYLHSVWLPICLQNFRRDTVNLCTANTLDAEYNAASKPCIQLGWICIYACIHFCFNIIVAGNYISLDAGNDTCYNYFVFNTCN